MSGVWGGPTGVGFSGSEMSSPGCSVTAYLASPFGVLVPRTPQCCKVAPSRGKGAVES